MNLTCWLQIDFSGFMWFVWITLGIMNGIKKVTQHLDLWFPLLSEANVFHQSDSHWDLGKWTVAKELMFFSGYFHLSNCGIVLASTS